MHAQEDGESLVSELSFDDSEGEEVFVANASVSVTDADGVEVATGVSDSEGLLDIALPGPGAYLVTIDTDTLDDGVSLADPTRQTLEVDVDPGEAKRVIFRLSDGSGGGSTAETGLTSRRIFQRTADGLKLGLFLAMASVGLSLIFGTTGLVNFAHGEMMTFGMLTAFFWNVHGAAGVFGFLSGLPGPFGNGVPLVFAAVLTALCGAVFGYTLDRVVFRPLRDRGVSNIAQLVVSIGLSILVRYTFLYIFRGDSRDFADFSAQSAREYGPIVMTTKDLIGMGVSVVLLVLVGLLLQKTRIGKAMRAVSDNRDLAESSGINVQQVITWVWVSGGALAATAGVFFGFDIVRWDSGFRNLLLIFAAVTLGGLGTAYGALVGSIVIGLGVSLSTIWLPFEFKNVMAMMVMVLVLLVRPQGILGKAERIG